MSERWPWVVLFVLGCYHGINPAMGWLFAVALGLQERSTRAVLTAIVPIAIGHIVSIVLVVAVGVLAASVFPHRAVHLAAAALLLAFGAYRLAQARHPRWVGMRVGFWSLVFWGFLMSSAHGAGLMLLPFVTMSATSMSDSMSMPMADAHAQATSSGLAAVMVAVHTLGYLLATSAIALLVYQKLGLSLLRTAWFNVDAVWAIALFATGLIALIT
ncbi:MAG: hypothetical protein ACXVAF_15365 [Vulcanimicrobiaceae bacterium]